MKLLASRTFFQGILITNAFLVLLPVFFLFNSSLRESNEFARTPFALARNPFWRIIEESGAKVNLAHISLIHLLLLVDH